MVFSVGWERIVLGESRNLEFIGLIHLYTGKSVVNVD